MEYINVFLDNGNGTEFDGLLEGSRKDGIPQVGQSFDIATKENATTGGNTAVIVSFLVKVGGETKRVQAVTTEKLIITALEMIKNRRDQQNASMK